MQFATDAIVFQQGIRTKTAILDVLGRNRTSVWGMWSPDKCFTDNDETQILDQILLSMVHPAEAHSCFRLTIRLRNRVGALSAAAEILGLLYINVVSSTCSVSGEHHSTWSLLCRDASSQCKLPNGAVLNREYWLASTYLSALIAEDALRYVDYELRTADVSVDTDDSSTFIANRLIAYRKRHRADDAPWRLVLGSGLQEAVRAMAKKLWL